MLNCFFWWSTCGKIYFWRQIVNLGTYIQQHSFKYNFIAKEWSKWEVIYTDLFCHESIQTLHNWNSIFTVSVACSRGLFPHCPSARASTPAAQAMAGSMLGQRKSLLCFQHTTFQAQALPSLAEQVSSA